MYIIHKDNVLAIEHATISSSADANLGLPPVQDTESSCIDSTDDIIRHRYMYVYMYSTL